MPNGAATKLEAKLGLSSRRKRPPSLPIDPTTGKLDESEVPLDEIQSQFFLLRSDGGVGCRYCSDFLTKEQKRPLYPLRDHVHSVHFKIYPYRCKDCLFETSSYRLSFAHAETMGHRRVIVQRHSAAPLTKVTPSLKRSPEPPIIKSKTKRKSNPLGGEKRSFLGGETQRSLALIENDAIIIEQPDHEVSQETLDQATENDPGADWTGSVWTPNQTRDLTPDQHISSRLQDQPEERPSTSPVDDLTSGSLSPRMEDQDLLQLPYAAPSFLPTPPLIPRIEKEYFRYNIEGLLQCAKCEFRVHSASTDGPGCKKALLEHVYAMHIENLPWTCRDCQFTTKFRSNLNRHCRKLRHAPNSERDAPPGHREPATRVVAASAKRVKWAGVTLGKDDIRSANAGGKEKTDDEIDSAEEDRPREPEHAYAVPKVMPSDRLEMKRRADDENCTTTSPHTPTPTPHPSHTLTHPSHTLTHPSHTLTHPSHTLTHPSHTLTHPSHTLTHSSQTLTHPSSRKRKSPHLERKMPDEDHLTLMASDVDHALLVVDGVAQGRELPNESDDDADKLCDAEAQEAERREFERLFEDDDDDQDAKEMWEESTGGDCDTRWTADVIESKHVTCMENAVQCNICGFVIRKTARVSEPLSIMLAHVCGHLELTLHHVCQVCDFATTEFAQWEAHQTESEIDSGPLGIHERTFKFSTKKKDS